jgi:hypothetical protein
MLEPVLAVSERARLLNRPSIRSVAAEPLLAAELVLPLEAADVRAVGAEARAPLRLAEDERAVPEPDLARVPEPDLARVPEPDLARVPEPDLARVGEPDLAGVPEPDLARVAELPEVPELRCEREAGADLRAPADDFVLRAALEPEPFLAALELRAVDLRADERAPEVEPPPAAELPLDEPLVRRREVDPEEPWLAPDEVRCLDVLRREAPL